MNNAIAIWLTFWIFTLFPYIIGILLIYANIGFKNTKNIANFYSTAWLLGLIAELCIAAVIGLVYGVYELLNNIL